MITGGNKWIDVSREDKNWFIRDWYIQATILADATSLHKLMCVIYVS